jgi:hypothetical protein
VIAGVAGRDHAQFAAAAGHAGTVRCDRLTIAVRNATALGGACGAGPAT